MDKELVIYEGLVASVRPISIYEYEDYLKYLTNYLAELDLKVESKEDEKSLAKLRAKLNSAAKQIGDRRKGVVREAVGDYAAKMQTLEKMLTATAKQISANIDEFNGNIDEFNGKAKPYPFTLDVQPLSDKQLEAVIALCEKEGIPYKKKERN